MRMANNLTTFMCRFSGSLRTSTSWNPQGFSRPVMGLLYLYIYLYLLLQKSVCIFSTTWPKVTFINFEDFTYQITNCDTLSFSHYATVGQSLLTIEASRSYSDTPPSVGLPRMRDQPEIDTSSSQHTQQSKQTDRCHAPQLDSNPQSQQATCRRPTP